MNKDTLKKLHGHIVKLSNELVDSGISSLIINPPKNDINYVIEMEEYSSETQGGYDIIDEKANQELRNMHEETGGFWRIENDLGDF